MTDPRKWIKTLPHSKTVDANASEYQLDHERWVDTIKKTNKKKSLSMNLLISSIFIIGLVFISAIKNKTKNLQKEINELQTSINELKLNLHYATLENELITSPENIYILAKENLDTNLVSYKHSQIKYLNEKKNYKNNLQKTKLNKIVKKDEKKLSQKLKIKVAKKIEDKKKELKKLQEHYNEPKSLIKSPKAQRWVVLQVVKALVGMPVIPGR